MNYSTFLSSIFLIAHIAHFATIGSPISRATPNHKNSHPRSEGYVLIPPSHVTTTGSKVPLSLSQCKTSGKFEPPSSSRRPQETNKCPCYSRFVTPARSLFFFRGQRSAYIYNRRGKVGGAHNGNKNVNLWGGKRTSFGSACIRAYRTGSNFSEKALPFITQPCCHLSDHPLFARTSNTPILRVKR